MDKLKDLKKTIEKFKFPILILIVGMILLLLPSGSRKTEVSADAESELLSMVLSESEGIGEAKILISKNGVIVVCSGADSALARLSIIRAVRSYTGFSSDKITILKLE